MIHIFQILWTWKGFERGNNLICSCFIVCTNFIYFFEQQSKNLNLSNIDSIFYETMEKLCQKKKSVDVKYVGLLVYLWCWESYILQAKYFFKIWREGGGWFAMFNFILTKTWESASSRSSVLQENMERLHKTFVNSQLCICETGNCIGLHVDYRSNISSVG